jgi:type II secretory pathway pseudopilin PulG
MALVRMNPNNASLIGRRRSLPYAGPCLQHLQSYHGLTVAKQRDPDSIRGFTLAELLIATSVTAGLVLMLGWMLGSLMRTSSHATARVDAFRDARAAMQMIERDLRNLISNQWDNKTPPNPITKPAAYFALDKVWQDPNDPYSANNTAPNHQLFALVADQTSPSSGDVCAIGYYCRWDDQLHAYSLRRFFRNSTDTLGAIRSAVNNYAGDSILYTPGLTDPVLAAYIWNFKVTMYNATGTAIDTSQAGNYPYICDPSATSRKALPAAIEISFNAMSPQAARTVMSVTAGMPNSTATAYWMNMDANLVAPHTYQFRSRINLP